MIRGDQTPRAGHVFHHDGRIARNIFPHVSGDGSGVGIESTAGGESNDDANDLAAIEFFACPESKRSDGQGNSDEESESRKESSVHISPFLSVRMKDDWKTLFEKLAEGQSLSVRTEHH